MQRIMKKSKIHTATITGLELYYEGSVTIDRNLLEMADMLPGEQVQTDEEILEFWRTEGMSVYHPVGSAKMGPAEDPTAVVDNELRVHGVESLRIADASIFPLLPSGNTHAPTVAVAEKAADLILAKRGQTPFQKG